MCVCEHEKGVHTLGIHGVRWFDQNAAAGVAYERCGRQPWVGQCGRCLGVALVR
jgi:hypothetical protein